MINDSILRDNILKVLFDLSGYVSPPIVQAEGDGVDNDEDWDDNLAAGPLLKGGWPGFLFLPKLTKHYH